MLIPSKNYHPDDTVLAAATCLLLVLRAYRILQYEELRSRLLTRNDSDYLFTPAIDLLYLLGLVEYHPNTDAFEYVGS